MVSVALAATMVSEVYYFDFTTGCDEDVEYSIGVDQIFDAG